MQCGMLFTVLLLACRWFWQVDQEKISQQAEQLLVFYFSHSSTLGIRRFMASQSIPADFTSFFRKQMDIVRGCLPILMAHVCLQIRKP